MKRISFIVPTFNRSGLIAESLKSILGEMSDDDELIVVDDGSTDNTAEVIRPFGPKVKYVYQENSGKAAALNLGLSLISGRFVWICDDDDILFPNAVSALVAEITETKADLVFGRYTRFAMSNRERIDLGTGYWPDLSQGSLRRHILEDAFVMQNAALVDRSAYQRVGPFDEAMPRSLDYEMFVRLALSCSMSFVDQIIFGQRKHEGARGPHRHLHAAAESENVWLEYDRLIFERIATQLPEAAYAGLFEGPDTLVQRAALLQRACIMARHDLWDRATADLEAAASIQAETLTDCEIAVASRILNGKHVLRGALNNDILRRLRALHARKGRGREIVLAMLRGALWRLRPGKPSTSDYRRLILRIMGPLRAGYFVPHAALPWKRSSMPELRELIERRIPMGEWRIAINTR